MWKTCKKKMRKTCFKVHVDPKTLQKYVMKTTDEWENDKENYSGGMPKLPSMYLNNKKNPINNIQV